MKYGAWRSEDGRPRLDRQRPVQPVRAPERAEQRSHAVLVSGASRRVEGEERSPGSGEGKCERTLVVRPPVVELRPREAGADRHERGRLQRRGEQLYGSRVREPVHADAPVAAGQGRCPLDRVVAVLRLVEERVEAAVGRVAPARVLHDHHVALPRVPGRVRVTPVAVRRGLVVRQPEQEHGVDAAAQRPVDVCAQDDPVAHRARDVALDGDAEQSVDAVTHGGGR